MGLLKTIEQDVDKNLEKDQFKLLKKESLPKKRKEGKVVLMDIGYVCAIN